LRYILTNSKHFAQFFANHLSLGLFFVPLFDMMQKTTIQPEALFQKWALEADAFLTSLPYANRKPASLYDPLDYFMKMGGKRIRPVLTLAAHYFSGGNEAAILSRACGVELFHNFSLVHDDIMDQAPTRRGKETVHTHWNVNTAILSGDLMLIEAYQLLMAGDTQTALAVLKSFNRTAADVCIGQAFDMEFEKTMQVSASEYLQMIEKKTAVLLGCALEIGGISAGLPEIQTQKLYEFGCKAGLAFQLWDDWLDAFGTPENTGKQPGGDVLAKKKTLLVIRFMEQASPEAQGRFLHAFHHGKVEDVLHIWHQHQLAEHIRAEVMTLRDQAIALIPATGLSEEGLAFLTWMTDFFIVRTK
jgi:geranylgeranyl diphosphate synthase, type II